MGQYVFGAGSLFGIPLTDAYGNPITNGTPVKFGTLQDVSLDIGFDVKELYGNLQFPVAIGRGKGKISGKASFAQLNGMLLNNLFFGQTQTAAGVADVVDTTGATIPATPFTITPTPPNTGVWSVDLGVLDSNGLPMTKVASAPTTGQYSVTAGAYLFAAADTGKTVFINYQYTFTSTTATTETVMNVAMGQAPIFQAEFQNQYNGKNLVITLPNCVSTKITFATKLDDFMVPAFDFAAFANSSGQVIKVSTTDK